MYAVSNAFKTAIANPVVRFNITGKIGSETFTKDNILQGTFKIVNQCSDESECQIGSVYIGELSATFTGLALNRYTAIGKKIVPKFGLKISSNPDVYEYVPLGIYTIQEAEISAAGLTVKAYDNMSKLDKGCADQFIGQLHDIAKFACTECGVELANANFNDFANGTAYFEEYSETDIETYRDLLYWIAQTMGAFVTANRDGKIEFRQYGQTVVDTIDNYHRFRGAKFSDYVTRYTGMSVVNLRTESTKYYHVTPDDGLTYNLGSNPFLQMRANNDTHCEAVLTALQNIQYVPFECEAVANPAYDLGDILSLSGGLGDDTKLFCVNKFELTYNGNLKLKGAGKNPALASAKSKSDKSIQGLLNNVNKNEYRDYEQKNVSQFVIGDNEEIRICKVRLASNNATKALIHLEVNLESEANAIAEYVDVDVSAEMDEHGDIEASGIASGDDIFRLVSAKETKGVVRYLINSEESAFKPVEQWTDGKHVLHLMYVLALEAGYTAQFEVYMKAQGGEITIPAGGLWFYGAGRGLVGDGKWDGLIECQDNVSDFQLIEITLDGVGETVGVDTIVPIGIVLTDSASEWLLEHVTMDSISESITITMHLYSMPRITEYGEIRITEEGDSRYTEGD